MSTIVTMPQKGLTEESAVIAQWYVEVGDTVKKGDLLFATEIGKATFDVESEANGTVLELFAEAGDDVAIKTPVCVIGTPGESYERLTAGAAQQRDKVALVDSVTATPVQIRTSDSAVEDVFISPRARAAAEHRGIDFTNAIPTGAEGRIIERDIDTLAAKRPAPKATTAEASPAEEDADFTIVPNSGIRKVIAKNMHDSIANMAQLSMTAYFDATEILAFREKVKKKGAEMGYGNISINDMILYAVSRTILDHPLLNAHYSDKEMKLFKHVNLGVATDTERGLMVPTLMRGDTKSLNQISLEAKELSAACRENRISPQALSGGTITISNLGNTGISSFTPVINPPQTALVGVCGIEWKVRPGKDGTPELYQAIGLSLTIDHRAVDGAPAARFLNDLCRRLENFTLLLAK
ncbi:MAG: dihydrolipoamide acetyltransferase family protein [Pyramidobacter sp.]|nr:dihydrolipoamide acetyltransferase family protein [Pyramidobacter sp.]